MGEVKRLNIFEQYGIKEVADCTLYSIHRKTDGSGEVYYVPALYFDTLKISTTDKTAESTWAEGGQGNARLIAWDHSKQINVSLEDALCTPASLSMCWNGVLNADWEDAQLNYNMSINDRENPVNRISRMQKSFFPRRVEKGSISRLLPKLEKDYVNKDLDLLQISSVVDGTDVRGTGVVRDHTYNWKMVIESAVKSIAVVPDRFFDVRGKSYSIDQNRKISVSNLPTYNNYKDAIIYKINSKNVKTPRAKIIFNDGTEPDYKGSFDTIKEIYEKLQENNSAKKKSSTLTATDVIYNGTNIKFDISKATSSTKTYTNGTKVSMADLTKDGVVTPAIIDDCLFCVSATVKEGSSTNNPEYVFFEDFEEKFQISTVDTSGKTITVKMPNFHTKKNTGLINYLYQVEEDTTDGTVVDYAQNRAMTSLMNRYYKTDGAIKTDELGSVNSDVTDTVEICQGDYLAIIVDNNDDYYALIGVTTVPYAYTNDDFDDSKQVSKITWYQPRVPVEVSQFKGIDMWLHFESINALIYFLITKYEDNIKDIIPSTIDAQEDSIIWKGSSSTAPNNWAVNKQVTQVTQNEDNESVRASGRLWSYINPHTMQPYPDDYWFHQGEPYYIKSLTVSPKSKKLKAQSIVIKADTFPGMYMLVGETYIRSRTTGEDEHMQIKFPLCKVKSENSLTLEASGDPVTFNLELEVAKPADGVMMELTTYETADRMVKDDDGHYYAVDGSSVVLSE